MLLQRCPTCNRMRTNSESHLISFPIKLRDISQCLPLPGVILHSTALGGGWGGGGGGGGEQHMTKQLNVSSHHINIYLYTIKQQQQNKLRPNVESYNIPQTQTLTTPNTTGHWTSNSSLCTQLYPSQHYNNDNNKISPFLFILVSLSCTNVKKISVQTRSQIFNKLECLVYAVQWSHKHIYR